MFEKERHDVTAFHEGNVKRKLSKTISSFRRANRFGETKIFFDWISSLLFLPFTNRIIIKSK